MIKTNNIKDVEFDFDLLDDGTLDTVISVYNEDTDERREYRYSQEFAEQWRDSDGCLDFDEFVYHVVFPDACDDIWGDELEDDDVEIYPEHNEELEHPTGWVVIVGTLHRGFTVKGPFDSFVDALQYAHAWHHGIQCEVCRTSRIEVQ